jgi:acetaldehyde dehydrogenase (acetylating)
VQPVACGEIVATIASKSAGPGTRYLPVYAGNLDIMTAAAVRVAQEVYERRSALVGAK